MKLARNPKNGKTRRRTCLLLALALALWLLPAAAQDAYIPSHGLSLRLPEGCDVLTQDIRADDPTLALYGLSADQVRGQLQGEGLALKAMDISGAYVITLALTPDGGPDYQSLSEEDLRLAAASLGAGEVSLYSGSQAAFFQVAANDGRSLIAQTRAGGTLATLRLTASSRLSDRMARTLRRVAQSMDFGLMQ